MTAPQLPQSGSNRSTLAVSKDYLFLTFQGEGPRLGSRTVFLRLAGCNFSCTWCDTPYTWDWKRYNIKEEAILKHITDVACDIDAYTFPVAGMESCHSLTITGGEPLLQAKALDSLFLTMQGIKEINFETNGTIFPSWTHPPCPIHYVVSPKLKNSGQPSIILQEFIEEGADFKFVCSSPSDLEEVEVFNLPLDRVWIMPEGTDPVTLTQRAQELAQPVLERGWNLTTRYHQYLYGNARGR